MRIEPAWIEIASSPSSRGATARREDRFPSFFGLKANATQRLDRTSLAIIGAGSVGWNLALHVARLGVKELRIIDPARVKAQSILTHPISAATRLGKPKATALGRLCKDLNPRMKVRAFTGPVQALSAADFVGVDAGLVAPDNLSAELHAGQVFLHLGKPLLNPAVFGPTLSVQVRSFGNAEAKGPCPACVFSQDEWRLLNEEANFSCNGSRRDSRHSLPPAPPTMSVSFLCSLAADLALTVFLRNALELGDPVLDKLLDYSAYTHRLIQSDLKRKSNCPCDHTSLVFSRAPRPLARCSLRELADSANLEVTAESPLFSIPNAAWAESGLCRCAGRQRLERFLTVDSPLRCPRCRSRLEVPEIYRRRTVSARLLGPALERSLARLGAADARWVLLRSPAASVLIQPPTK